ncbi:MAG: NAD-dependent epimerase/dehydratase family protein [Actinomycetota bacterium]|jgi:nucleoside-diphosphate-sugar epimerase|nr:NAD-dependent epimerase/dehydratase family protein [Actinomycetota bacterium]
MNILVTGGTGFVGRHLVDRLAAAGHRVVSYNRDFTARAADGVEAVQGELFDLPRLTAAIGEFAVEVIVHTAGMSHPGLSVAMPVTTFAANADGTLWVLEAARTTGVSRAGTGRASSTSPPPPGTWATGRPGSSGTGWRSTSTGYETDWGERHAANRRAPAHVSTGRGRQALEDRL